jgi:hypothetical protein
MMAENGREKAPVLKEFVSGDVTNAPPSGYFRVLPPVSACREVRTCQKV